MGKTNVAVQSTAVWPEQCSTNIYKTHEARSSSVEKTGHENDPLFGQYAHLGQQQRGDLDTLGYSTKAPGSNRLYSQRRKSIFVPTQHLEFLGFILDSQTMMISLPLEKLHPLKKAAKKMISWEEISVSELARLIDTMVAAHPAILPAPLHYRCLEKKKGPIHSPGSLVQLNSATRCQDEVRLGVVGTHCNSSQ